MPRITIHESGKKPQPYRFDLTTDVVKFGRSHENEIILECGSISSKHAEMVRVPGGFELRDLASTNGTIKDGERVDVCRLSDGDHLTLGDVGFEFELSEDEIATLAAEIKPQVPPEEPAPAPARKPKARQPSETAGKKVSGWWLFLAFLVLGSVAFYFGASMRHENETGVSLGSVIKKHLSTPDVNRIKAIKGENPDNASVEPSSDQEEASSVIAPVAAEELPALVEDLETQEILEDEPRGDEEDIEPLDGDAEESEEDEEIE